MFSLHSVVWCLCRYIKVHNLHLISYNGFHWLIVQFICINCSLLQVISLTIIGQLQNDIPHVQIVYCRSDFMHIKHNDN
ncbi:unnamed protein product [Schistosoma intercalatum]|nr:unnamed protein product [Schistosoma intercalatum]